MTSFLDTRSFQTISKMNSRRHAVAIELSDDAARRRTTGDPRLDLALAAQR